jgi:hypothetical protein
MRISFLDQSIFFFHFGDQAIVFFQFCTQNSFVVLLDFFHSLHIIYLHMLDNYFEIKLHVNFIYKSFLMIIKDTIKKNCRIIMNRSIILFFRKTITAINKLFFAIYIYSLSNYIIKYTK